MSYPGSMYGTFGDIWAATSMPIVNGSLKLGQEEYDPQTGRHYRFVKANGNIAAGASVKMDSGQADGNTVIQTTAAGDPFDGVNDASANSPTNNGSGVALVAGNYFWMCFRGPVSPLVAGTPAIGSRLSPGATAGQLSATAAPSGDATAEIVRCVARAVSAGGAQTACYLY